MVEVSSSGLARYVQRVSVAGTTVVIVENPFEASVRGRFKSPFVRSSNGSGVFVSWLRLDEEQLGAYANRAATLLNRSVDAPRTVVLLAGRSSATCNCSVNWRASQTIRPSFRNFDRCRYFVGVGSAFAARR